MKKWYAVIFLMVSALVLGADWKQEEILKLGVGEKDEMVKYLVIPEQEKLGVDTFFVDKDEKIYISNSPAGKIKIFQNRKFLSSFAIPDGLQPCDMDVSPLNQSSIYLLFDNGKVYNINDFGYIITDKNYQNTTVKRGNENIDAPMIRKLYIDDSNTANIIYQDGGMLNLESRVTRSVLPNIRVKYEDLIKNSDLKKSLIGTDFMRNTYLLVTQTITNKIGELEIEEAIYKFDSNKKLMGIVPLVDEKDFIVPSKYVYVNKNNGKIYQIICRENEVVVFNLSVGDNFKSQIEKKRVLLENSEKNFIPKTGIMKRTSGATLTRTQMYERAAEIADLKWTYRPSSNGDKPSSNVELPSHLRSVRSTITSTGVPYCWGGFDSIDTRSSTSWTNFVSAMNNGKFAGNVETSGGYKSGTAGLDCSGFVSAVWKLPSKQGTSGLLDFINRISYSNLKKMDILDDSGSHVVFYLSEDSEGVNTIESTCGGTEQRAKRYYRTWKYLSSSGYVAGVYKNTKEEVVSNLTVSAPVEVKTYVTTTISGTATGAITRIVGYIDGKEFLNGDVAVKNNAYSFTASFSATGAARVIKIVGYNSSGGIVKTVTRNIKVTGSSTLTLNSPAEVKLLVTTTISGTATADIKRVLGYIDGVKLLNGDVAVQNGKYSFTAAFSKAGTARVLKMDGYDSSGNIVDTVTKTIKVY